MSEVVRDNPADAGTPRRVADSSMSLVVGARTYNQDHVARKYSKGHRRVSVYVAWTYPGEANRDVAELDNRFSTLTEVRRVLWPSYEAPEWSDPMRFQQGIAGSLELFFWAWVRLQRVVTEATGYEIGRASCRERSQIW